MQGRIDTAAINAALFNIGDQEVFELDVNLNISPNYGGTTVPVEFTAGEYELKFLDTNPDRTAWIFGPYAGAEYWVRNMRIRKTEYDNNDLLFNGTASYGVGDTPAAAYADAAANSALIHQFTVPQDMIGYAHVTDLDTNNMGGLTIQITKVIPEPSIVSLITLIGASGYAICRRFLV